MKTAFEGSGSEPWHGGDLLLLDMQLELGNLAVTAAPTSMSDRWERLHQSGESILTVDERLRWQALGGVALADRDTSDHRIY